MTDIYVATISHKYGVNTYAAKSEHGMIKQVADFCREWWDDTMVNNEPMPESDTDIIDLYFENSPFESWEGSGKVELMD